MFSSFIKFQTFPRNSVVDCMVNHLIYLLYLIAILFIANYLYLVSKYTAKTRKAPL